MSNGYAFIVDGSTIPLTRFENVLFVTPARDEHPATVAARLARSTRLAIDPRCPSDAVVVWGERQKLEEIRSYRDIRNTRGAFGDPQGNLCILTNEILIRFRPGSEIADREALLARFDARIVERTEHYWKVRVNDPADDAPLLWAYDLAQEGIVEYAEPNALVRPTFQQPQNEPRFGNQWHLQNTGQNGGTAGADVDALGAWAITTGSPAVRIVVHDTGVDINHPDLVANIGPGWDYDNNDDDATNTGDAHGTACAGMIAAAVNGQGVTGIAPGCQIIPLRCTGWHYMTTLADAFDWAARQGRIISCSWTIFPSNTMSHAIRRVVSAGVTVFCCTGNGAPGTTGIGYPASLSETIAVGASTNQDVRAAYSQYGQGLDVVAPSGGGTLGIETTDVQGANGYNTAPSPAGDYCNANDTTGFSGTSAATPLVAGIAGLMLSVDERLTPADIRMVLHDTADKIDMPNAKYDSSGWNEQYGHGRVDAAAAVRTVAQYAAVLHEGAPGHGIGGYDLANPADQVFAFDYESSGRLDHLALYRPGTGTLWILTNNGGVFAPVFREGDPGHGIGGYDLASPADRVFAFDWDHSGKLDHLALYRPGTGTIWILANNGGAFAPVYAEGYPGNGIGGYDLASPADQAFAFDYDHSGKLDHLVLYRPGTGTIWILANNGGVLAPVYAEGYPGNGIGGYDLASPADRVFAFDYNQIGKPDHLVLYRPGKGALWILRNLDNAFMRIYSEGEPGDGIGGYDLASPRDRAFAFDYAGTGNLDHMVLYRPGKGTLWILARKGKKFVPVFRRGEPGGGIAGYDLASEDDRCFAFDYGHSGRLDHLVLYRPGAGTIWILGKR